MNDSEQEKGRVIDKDVARELAMTTDELITEKGIKQGYRDTYVNKELTDVELAIAQARETAKLRERFEKADKVDLLRWDIFPDHLERRILAPTRRRIARGISLDDLSTKVVLSFWDLARFREINKKLGHEGGDIVLELFAEAINGKTRMIDVKARYGGDENALALPETTEAAIKDKIVSKILAEFRRKIKKKGVNLIAEGKEVLGQQFLTLDIGVRVAAIEWYSPNETAEDLIKRGLAALDRVKELGEEKDLENIIYLGGSEELIPLDTVD